jgi:hypothetical protein
MEGGPERENRDGQKGVCEVRERGKVRIKRERGKV